MFQSTLPRGERPKPRRIVWTPVSIHAPAWGATTQSRPRGERRSALSVFNPRSRVGSDASSARRESGHGFNPRSRVGSDRDPRSIADAKFQSTLPRGERLGEGRRIAARMVSIHAPAWGATIGWLPCAPACFNPRSRVGERRRGRPVDRSVSIHAPAWGATNRGSANRFMSFNPRSRVGSDNRRSTLSGHPVSIHAPAWGATPSRLKPDSADVSIHAPAWGATDRRHGPRCFNPRSRVGSDQRASGPFPFCFNPRSRVGSDTILDAVEQGLVVSIHAPAWGATTWRERWRARFNPRSRVGSDSIASSFAATRYGGFNPRSRVGSDHGRRCWSAYSGEFQSTLPRGERLANAGVAHTIGFNPRSRVGSDARLRQSRGRDSCFNPRSRVGSDRTSHGRTRPRFNPRSRVGSDDDRDAFRASSVSIHAPRVGSDRCPGGRSRTKFQSTLPRGERR